MKNLKIKDISRSHIHNSEYDLAIVCCGYEPRCTFLSEIVDTKNIKNTIVFSYEEYSNSEHRLSIDDFFMTRWGKKKLDKIAADKIELIFQELNQWYVTTHQSNPNIKILIDYSSMTKSWLSTIIFFFLKFLPKTESKKLNIILDFSYSIGEYPTIIENKQFTDPIIIPGCEGSPLTHEHKAAIFLLGFDPIGPQALFNTITPDRSYGIYASPSAKDAYVNQVLSCNSEFINVNLGGKESLLGLPLSSVATTYEYFNQIILPMKEDHNVSIVLFGPKPHVLSAILTATNNLNVTCMYSKAVDSTPRLVQCIGELVITRVTY